MSQDDTATLLRSIGCHGHAEDVSGLRLAERIVAGERRRIAAWLRGTGFVGNAIIADQIEAGEHVQDG